MFLLILGILADQTKENQNFRLLFSECQCSEETTFDSMCDHISGNCTCKDVFTGPLCDLCPPMTIGIYNDTTGNLVFCESKLIAHSWKS